MAAAQILEELRRSARERTFAVVDPDRRACVLHGYLLALEELERAQGREEVAP